MKKKTTGRPPRAKDILKARELSDKGLSVREISWVVLKREDPKTIQRWRKLPLAKVKKLSTA